jgi:Ca2+-binding RTX toxin-like protein
MSRLFSTRTRAASSLTASGRRSGFRPTLEALEDRLCRSGIAIDLNNGVLTIVGTNNPDQVQVSVVGNEVEVVATELNFLGQVIDVDVEDFDLNDVNQIFFAGLAGNDEFVNQTAIASLAHGDTGNDSLIGGALSDQLFGDDGNDTVRGGAGNDTVRGGDGNDQLFGDLGNDQLFGDDGNDGIRGGAGNDTAKGGLGDDNLFGDDGNDVLLGEDGRDDLIGGNGDDTLTGGAGNDDFDGGAGNDDTDAGLGDLFGNGV